jgi:hypothetical protein
MSVKRFKFVSPGVFINEIDNSFIPKQPDAIGPVVIGRATRGIAMQPTKIESYSDFVTMFGETVAGAGGRDIYRNGNYQSPMYGTYAAKAFLRSNVAPLTYLRLLGHSTSDGDSTGGDAAAGWKTTYGPAQAPSANGGAYGLWLFTSGSAANAVLGTGSLAAIWYIDAGNIYLSGTVYGGDNLSHQGATGGTTGSNNTVIGTDSDNLFTVVISGSDNKEQKIRFGFDDSADTFIRKRFNTNPQLLSTPGTFYPSSVAKDYWLGETFEQELRDRGFTSGSLGVMMAISKAATTGPWDMEPQSTREARTGWFIGQDLGTPAAYVPFSQQKLFRLVGRGHGEWLHKNCKISIEKIRQSTSTTTGYGTFSLVIRDISDTDSNVVVLERYDNLTLDPTSPNFVSRKIGDQYVSWDTEERRLKTYGDYPNLSKFVYVDTDADVEAGAIPDDLLPFGYFGPPRFRAAYDVNASGSVNSSPGGGGAYKADGGIEQTTFSSLFLTGGWGIVSPGGRDGSATMYLSAGLGIATAASVSALEGMCTGSFVFPVVRLRTSASDGDLSDPKDAYFGMQTTRTATSTTHDKSVADYHRLLYAEYTAGGGQNATDPYNVTGVEDYAYVFSLDDIVLKTAGGTDFYYSSGSRRRESSFTSASYENLLNTGVNRFTAPLWGGFDGFDIKKPDPLANTNTGMSATSTVDSSYVHNTWKRAIDTVTDPEVVDMNLLVAPGLTTTSLTAHMINVCEERADALALIDLPSVYIPPHEQYYSSRSSRIGTTPTNAANDLKDRQIDSSYGCTFYPWVQTRDESTGKLVWIPPSVAMLGVLGSSEAKSEVWFAPAGFNRGGLSEGAAGIPVTNASEKLTSKNRDTLYEARINPIASFPSTGIVVFGQKTLQERQSALDRINVRRLVIYLKKSISILSTQILFEQNVQATWNRFKSLVEPFLANVKTKFGITDYRLILDESTTTPDLIDQNILYAKIMIKPARAIEYIAIDFVIASTGASFDD